MTKRSKFTGLRLLGMLALTLSLTSSKDRHATSASSGADEHASEGHDARSPSDLPAQGWMDVLKRTFSEVSSDHVMLVAAGVTFYVLLALFPALAAMVSIYGLFIDPETIQDHLAALEGFLPGGAMTIISDQLESLTAQGSTGLGLAFVLGLGTSLWSANAGVKSIFEALNIAYEEPEKRGFVKLTLTAFMFTLGGILMVILALGAVVAVPIVLQNVPLGATLETYLNWLRWPVLLVIVAALIALLYRYGPSRQPAKWRWLSWGSGIAAVLWLAFSALFSWYVANFGSYDATYGSFGAVIGFMTWLWISTIVVITCAELNSELEHQTKKDTTTGPDKSMGSRGAVMADRAIGGPNRAQFKGDGI